jgi:aryl-alcohol dehydrogenase-like predicted oxidoreductase
MQQRTLGNSDIKITPIIFGGWQSGKSEWVGIEDSDTIAAHKAALDAGITTFDTAEAYGGGHSESILGEALSNRRDEIQILTKVGAHHLKHDDVLKACDKSLERLKTDHIDLYQIHWPSGSFGSAVIPIEETMSALNKLKDIGKIRAIGVSNFTKAQIVEASAFGAIESVQPPYSLFWRQAEKEIQPYCVEKDLSILAYSPLAQGLLTGKFGPDHVFPQGDHRKNNKLFNGDNFARAQESLNSLTPIAAKYDVSLGQLALAWLIEQPKTSAIVGARNSEQAVQNAAAAKITLDTSDIALIDSLGKKVTDHLDINPVLWSWG